MHCWGWIRATSNQDVSIKAKRALPPTILGHPLKLAPACPLFLIHISSAPEKDKGPWSFKTLSTPILMINTLLEAWKPWRAKKFGWVSEEHNLNKKHEALDQNYPYEESDQQGDNEYMGQVVTSWLRKGSSWAIIAFRRFAISICKIFGYFPHQFASLIRLHSVYKRSFCWW